MSNFDSEFLEYIIDYLLSESKIIAYLGGDIESVDNLSDKLVPLIRQDILIPGFFDSDFYLNKYDDVRSSDMLAIEHYIKFGVSEGRIGYLSELKLVVDDMYSKGAFRAVITSDRKLNYITSLDDVYSDDTSEKLSCRWFDNLSKDNGSFFSNSLIPMKEECLISKIDSYSDLSKLVNNNKFNDNYEIELFNNIVNQSAWNIDDIDINVSSVTKKHSDLFDVDYVVNILGVQGNTLLEIYLNWFRHERENVPNSYFKGEFYKTYYADLQGIEFPFEHYAFHGRFEGRKPNALTKDMSFGLEGVCKYSNKEIEELYPFFEKISVNDKSNFLLKLINYFNDWVNDYKHFEYLLSLINNQYFIDYFDADDFSESVDLWVKSKFNEDAVVLFDVAFVSNHLGLSTVSFKDAFMGWCSSGFSCSTTSLFDPTYYMSKHLDLKHSNINPVLHYFNHGQYENRSPNRLFDPLWIVNTYNSGKNTGLDFFSCSNKDIKPSPGLMPMSLKTLKELTSNAQENQWFDIKENTELKEQIEKAVKIDPRIKQHDPQRIHTVMPYNVDFYSSIIGLEEIIPDADFLIFRDSINFGGADVVLGHLYAALKLNEPNKIIKIISFGDIEEDVISARNISRDDVICLSNQASSIPLEHQANVVYDIVIGSRANRVYNVNSYGAWEAFKHYGKSLREVNVSLFAYLFCDDRDEFGNVAGYPASYFFPTIEYLAKVYLDSECLLNELKTRGAVIERYYSKIKVLRTPFKMNSVMKSPINTPTKRSVAWAGRFDEQKKPELLIEIAKLMPHIDFHVWGKAVLSKQVYDFSSYKNITLHGLYDDIDEMLIKGCAVYLYTSGWDGIPTILLDVVNIGLPILASNVGGVNEALPTWSLIDDVDNAVKYVEKIEEILSDATIYAQLMYEHRAALSESCSFEKYAKGLIIND